MLHAFGKGVADKADVIALLQDELLSLSGSCGKEDGEGSKEGASS